MAEVGWGLLHALLELVKLSLVINHLLLQMVLNVALHLVRISPVELLLLILCSLLSFLSLKLFQVHLSSHPQMMTLATYLLFLLPLICLLLIPILSLIITIGPLSVHLRLLLHFKSPFLNERVLAPLYELVPQEFEYALGSLFDDRSPYRLQRVAIELHCLDGLVKAEEWRYRA